MRGEAFGGRPGRGALQQRRQAIHLFHWFEDDELRTSFEGPSGRDGNSSNGPRLDPPVANAVGVGLSPVPDLRRRPAVVGCSGPARGWRGWRAW
ncbi:DUF6461 domain-containing protein [Streptomyces griseorubiginosus]|uniref:DUF6461 domain-containing protein n=1 Tax=Streptomyces griseorubiginosus TaxID=67304 RepID=UPI00364110C8